MTLAERYRIDVPGVSKTSLESKEIYRCETSYLDVFKVLTLYIAECISSWTGHRYYNLRRTSEGSPQSVRKIK